MTEKEFHLDQIRTDYRKGTLQENQTGNDPVLFFDQWFQEALTKKVTEVNAMMISTVDEQNHPHSRNVLLKGIENGTFLFYTNYNSAKGHQLAVNPHIAALFFWKELERQVRIEGKVEKLSPEASDTYFYSRPIDSQIGAIASPQSQVIKDRSVLEKRVAELKALPVSEIKRPDSWGGFKIIPNYFEFWQGRASRLHDRIIFDRRNTEIWQEYRLAP